MRVNNFAKFLSYEDTEHVQVVNFLKDKLPSDVIWFHVPNESKKSAFERYKHSIMGSKKGMSDFVFTHPKYKIKELSDGKKQTTLVYHGLFLELKSPEHNHVVKKGKDAGKIKKVKGTLSPEQKIIIEKLNKVKYKAVCCWGAEDAINVIKEYFELK